MTDQRRPKKRVRDPAATRAKLLQAAVDLVAARGTEGVTLQDAARLAKLSRGIAYHHFKDPEDLLREAMKWATQRLQEGVKRLTGASWYDRIMYSTTFVLENPDICRLMIADALAGRDLNRRDPFIKLVMKMFLDLIANKQARPGLDAEVATYLTFGCIAVTLMLRQQHKGGDMNALAERFTKEWLSILMSGIFIEGIDMKSLEHKAAAPTPSADPKAVRRK